MPSERDRVLADRKAQGLVRGPQGNVAAVVHMGAGQTMARGQHRGQDVVGHGTGDGGHRGDKGGGKGGDGLLHLPCDHAGGRRPVAFAQTRQLGHQIAQHRRKGIPRAQIGSAHRLCRPFGHHDQVNRAMDQPQMTVRRQVRRWGFLPAHFGPRVSDDIGHGAPVLRFSERWPDRR